MPSLIVGAVVLSALGLPSHRAGAESPVPTVTFQGGMTFSQDPPSWTLAAPSAHVLDVTYCVADGDFGSVEPRPVDPIEQQHANGNCQLSVEGAADENNLDPTDALAAWCAGSGDSRGDGVLTDTLDIETIDEGFVSLPITLEWGHPGAGVNPVAGLVPIEGTVELDGNERPLAGSMQVVGDGSNTPCNWYLVAGTLTVL